MMTAGRGRVIMQMDRYTDNTSTVIPSYTTYRNTSKATAVTQITFLDGLQRGARHGTGLHAKHSRRSANQRQDAPQGVAERDLLG